MHIELRIALSLTGAVKCLVYGSGLVIYGSLVFVAAVSMTLITYPHVAAVTAFAVAVSAVFSIHVHQEPMTVTETVAASAL
jgi:hypothetical protein